MNNYSKNSFMVCLSITSLMFLGSATAASIKNETVSLIKTESQNNLPASGLKSDKQASKTTFNNYTTQNGLGSNKVNSLYVDKNGTIRLRHYGPVNKKLEAVIETLLSE